MSPMEHAVLSVRDFGGELDDYLDIHMFLDSTKTHYPDWKHRAILHNSFGVNMCERVFGIYITNSNGIEIPVRRIAENHIKEDCAGKLPTIDEWIYNIMMNNMEYWMNSPLKHELEWLKKNHYNKTAEDVTT